MPGPNHARMHAALAWLQSSALGTFMRGSGPWTYPVVNLIHILGVGALFGAVLISIEAAGGVARCAAATITTSAVPVAMTGFALAAASGVFLFASNALDYENNPLLLVKFSAIGVGLVNVVALRLTAAWKAHANRDLSSSEARQLAFSVACRSSAGSWPLRRGGCSDTGKQPAKRIWVYAASQAIFVVAIQSVGYFGLSGHRTG